MPFRALDPRFPSLTFHCLCFYWLVCLVTLGVTIGSVIRQVGVYRADCSTGNSDSNSTYYGDVYSNITYYGNIPTASGCIPGDIAVFALGLGVAVIGMTQSSLQLFLFYKHHISPLILCIFNAIVMVLWILVIAIGWNPTYWSYDPTTGLATPNISGWLYTYSSYWAQDSVGYGVGATLQFAMGFAVMSIISFGIATLLALYAFIVYHRNWRRQRLADKETLITAPKLTEKTSSGLAPALTDTAFSPGGRTVPTDPVSVNGVSGTAQDGPTRSRSI